MSVCGVPTYKTTRFSCRLQPKAIFYLKFEDLKFPDHPPLLFLIIYSLFLLSPFLIPNSLFLIPYS